jgi:hypothetical protein
MSPLGFGHRNKTIEGAVRGQALVTNGDTGYSATTAWTSRATLQVTVSGQPPVKVVHDCWVDRGKELIEGFTIPVDVDPLDTQHLTIPWDEVPTIQERIANRDPVIIDPEGTWHQLYRGQAVSSVLPDMPTPYGDGTVVGWPPTHELKNGKQPGTALVIAASEDARGQEDNMMPTGRHSYSYRGMVSDGPQGYRGWVLLCVIPQYGERFGVYQRMLVIRQRFNTVLPVAIDPQDMSEIEVCWEDAPNLLREATKKIKADVKEMHERVEMVNSVGAASTAQALANIKDPVLREQTAQRMAKYGMGTTDPSKVPVAAAPSTDLERLEKLRASGILSDAEFEAQRAQIPAGQ